MKAFMPQGTKFNHRGFVWIAGRDVIRNHGTALAQKIQVWHCKKTWLKLTCRYDIRTEELVWEVERYSTAKTRAGAASLAASMTREYLDIYVDRLASYGDEVEKKQANAILKKKKQTNLKADENSREETIQW